MSMLYRKSVRDMTRRFGRTCLLILGILSGIVGLIALMEASSLLTGAFFYVTDAQNVPTMTFTVDHLPASVAKTIAHLPTIARFQIRTSYVTFWTVNGAEQNLEIAGDPTFAHLPMGAFALTSGRLPGSGEIVMDTSDQAIAALPLNHSIVVAAPDGHEVALRVVGLARTQGLAVWHTPAAFAIGYMSADALQQLDSLAPGASRINPLPHGTQLLIQSNDPTIASQTFATITTTLQANTITIVPGVSRYHDTSFDADAQLGVQGVLVVLWSVTGLLLLLVGAFISNMITTLVTEQTGIIGTMKALGGSRRQIIGSYLVTIGICSSIGTLLGVGLGLAVGYQLARNLAATVTLPSDANTIPLDIGPFAVAVWVLAAGVALGMVLPLCAALSPLWQGTRMTVREALSSYGISHRISTPRFQAVGSIRQRLGLMLPQTLWLSIRDLTRKPGRTLFTLFTFTTAVAVFFAVQLTNDSLRANIAQLGSTFHSELRVDLTQSGTPVPATAALQAIQALPNVARVEPIDQIPIAISHRNLELYGLSADTRLYQPHLVAGRWLQTQDIGDIVINESAATHFGFHIGMPVTVQLSGIDATALPTGSMPQQVTLSLIGIVHDINDVSASGNPQGRLGAAFVTLPLLNDLRGLPADAAERVWVQTYNHQMPALQNLQTQMTDALAPLGLPEPYILFIAQDLGQVSATEQIIALLFDSSAILIGLIGLFGLLHSLTTIVLERRLEIGILRSLGATGWRIGSVFGSEALALAWLAWVLGASLGFGGGVAILSLLGFFMPPIDLTFHPQLLLIGLLFVAGIAGLASIGPASNAARMRIARLLRYT